MRRRGALALAALLALACSDPREAELAGELATLQESRTPRTSFERMRAEADEGELAVRREEAELEALAGRIEEAGAAASAVEAAFQGEVARNGDLNREIQDAQARLRDATARLAELAQRVAIERGRAQTVRDQASVLVRELRPDDPEWARRLHLQSLEEFLRDVGQAWPRDPVLAPTARQPLPADSKEAARVGAELAARIRDRVSEVYALEGGEARAGTPAVVAGPGES
jgi:DNA repair exonuclease SbcCD ATPase subunit